MKRAYPNYPALDSAKPIYNLNRWVETMKEIYTKVHFGSPKEATIQSAIKDWDKPEVMDFRNWMEYYENGENKKYNLKTAQMYMPENLSGYYLPNHKVPTPITPIADSNKATVVMNDPIENVIKPELEERTSKEDKRRLIEDQRKKIIGRLHAAVKHLTMQEGHMLAADEFNSLLDSLYDLIKKFQTVNKVSLSNQLYTDLIIRQSNVLSRSGFDRSSRFLYKMAQGTPGGGNLINSSLPVASENVGGALPGALPPAAPSPGTPAPAPETPVTAPTLPPATAPAKKKDEAKKLPTDPLDKFLDNIDNNGLSDLNIVDDLEVELEDLSDADDCWKGYERVPGKKKYEKGSCRKASDDFEDGVIIVEAQDAVETPDSLANPETNVPVSSDLVPDQASGTPKPVGAPIENVEKEEASKVDDLLEQAFANITVDDLISKLESINNIFQQRVLSRELSIVDIMASRLGLSGYLASLSEVVSKNADSNNYCSSRIEEILTMLKGSIDSGTAEIDLSGKENQQSPQTEAVQRALQNKQDKEEKRKAVRKEIDNEGLDEQSPTTPTPAPATTPNLKDVATTPQPRVV